MLKKTTAIIIIIDRGMVIPKIRITLELGSYFAKMVETILAATTFIGTSSIEDGTIIFYKLHYKVITVLFFVELFIKAK